MDTVIARPFTLDHLDHVVLRVHDLEKSIAFYRMLGAEIGDERPAGTPVRITEGKPSSCNGDWTISLPK